MTEMILRKLGLVQTEINTAGLFKSKTVRVFSWFLSWKDKVGTVLYGLPLVIAFFIVWEIAPLTGIVSPIFFPPFSKAVIALKELLLSGELFAHIGVSLQRALAGFSLALVVAVPLGFLMGRYSRLEKIADLMIQGLRNTPHFALLPVFIMVLGIGEASKIAITFLAAVWFILINTISGVKCVDPLYLKAAKSMGTSDTDLFIKVILPASIPSIVSGARLGVKSSLMSVIGAEMLAAKSGLGFFIQNSHLMYRIPEMYAGILALAIFGLVINYLLVWFEKSATPWNTSTH
jgi:NitT/TauT family transport system permease protein